MATTLSQGPETLANGGRMDSSQAVEECGGTAVASCRKPKAAFENRVVKVLCLRILRSTLHLVAHE